MEYTVFWRGPQECVVTGRVATDERAPARYHGFGNARIFSGIFVGYVCVVRCF